MATYDKCGSTVTSLVASVMAQHHEELTQHGVKIDCLFAYSAKDKEGFPKGGAVKLQGYPCAAVVRIVPLKQRVNGFGDAEITIDGDRWPEWSEAERTALIDHELQHLELKRDKDGFVKTDDIGRPKLRMRLHDWQIGGFRVIAERYGGDSFDVQTAKEFMDQHGQYLLFGDSAPEPAPDAKKAAKKLAKKEKPSPPQTFDEDTTIDKILDAPEHEAAINQLRSRGCFTVEQFARFDADPATDWSKIDADAIAALRAAVEHHK